MRISDWSSDVCSSDLRILGALTTGVPLGCIAGISLTVAAAKWLPEGLADAAAWHSRIYYSVFVLAVIWRLVRGAAQIGRASCRERVCQYVYISVVAVQLKKTKHKCRM